MSNVSHTPGPWRVTETGAIEAAIPVAQRLPKRAGRGQQTRMSVATICNAAEPHMQPGEAEANARLIAAAPALLEALRGMVSIYDSVTQGQERERRDEWLPKARAALEAAK